jgi:hypothetical protein
MAMKWSPWLTAAVLLGVCGAGCSRSEKPTDLSALDKAYQAGILTKEEYGAKKAALQRQRALAALDAAHRAGILTADEYASRKAALVIANPLADAVQPPAAAPKNPAVIANPLADAAQPPAPPPNPPAIARPRFRVQPVFDPTMGGMLAYRFAVPQDWKAAGKTDWNYRDLYEPLRMHARAEAPDGSAWFEGYPAEVFFWGDHDTNSNPNAAMGGIHHRNITVQEAMVRYVIARYRSQAANLQILGYRPVTNLAQAMGLADAPGEGICVRIRYTQDNQPVDEEFYGLMTPVIKIPYTGPQGTWYEFHRGLSLVHSLGARSGKLESLRPLLGSIGPSVQNNPAWAKRAQDLTTQISNEFFRQLKISNDQGRAAVEMSRIISANNDRMIRDMDARRATSNAASGTTAARNANGSFERQTDDFDQYMRGTEHVADAWGQVSDQPNQYNYHWTDGFGNFVHSNDVSYDPNTQSNQHYEKTRPGR